MTTTYEAQEAFREYAKELLFDALRARKMTYKQLSELLQETYEMDISWQSLSRKLNRGAFDAGFFMAVIAALKAERIDVANAPRVRGKVQFIPLAVTKQQTWMPQ